MLFSFTIRQLSINRIVIRELCQTVTDEAFPPIKVFVKNRYAQFIDSLRIRVSGGSGGNGLPRYGGIGGKGGDVYVEACDNTTLKKLKDNKKLFKAQSGEHSAHFRIVGKSGNDEIIKAPIGVTIVNEHGGQLGSLNKAGDKVLVAIGGRGGDLSTKFCGIKGQSHTIILDLKLIADVGFVGFPNAGKSTLLKALSRASPKIASYPFTTINPNIGILEYDDYRQIRAADLPGLIEGAHANVGLGHSFLKHIERTKLLLFVIDVNGFRYRPDWPMRSPLDTFLLLNKELELYDDRLLLKPSILVISKIDDSICEGKYETFLQKLRELNTNGLESIDEEMRPSQLIKFDEIIGICAKKGFNIPELRECIREAIDLNYEIEREKNGQSTTFREILDSKQTQKIKKRAEEDNAYLI